MGRGKSEEESVKSKVYKVLKVFEDRQIKINMKVEKFEDIIAWQKAKVLTVDIYRLLQSSKDYGFRDQIQRAAVSIMNNIAEGFERKGDKEFSHFLFIAKGSSGEVRSMLALGKELGYFSEADFSRLISFSEEISRLLSGFISSLR